jgi:hypothetical protein
MSADEILQTAQRRLIVAEKEIREKAKAAEAMYVNSRINHDPYGTDKWRSVANAYEECYRQIYNRDVE